MAWDKRTLVNMAFDELALAGYVFDLTPEEINTAILRMDSMMATWEVAGIRVGYFRSQDPKNADPDQDSGLPDEANEAVYLNLAIRLASSFGKQIPLSTTAPAKQAYDLLLGRCLSENVIPMQQRGNLPAGAGWKLRNGWRGPFVTPPTDTLTTGPDGPLDFNGLVPINNPPC